MSKYDKFDKVYMKVPVQFGKMSKRERRCRSLGLVGSVAHSPFQCSDYYRIDDGEVGAGRFFAIYKWKGSEKGKTSSDGQMWHFISYLKFSELPDEIKKRITDRND